MAVPDFISASAELRTLIPGGTYGNLQVVHAAYTAAGMTQNKVAGIVRIPAHSVITHVEGNHAAFGASTVLEIGHVSVDGGDADPDAYADVADASSASSFTTPNASQLANQPAALAITEDTYITVKQTADATGAGVINMVVHYIYVGI